MPQAKNDWIHAATRAFNRGGLDSVRVESLAKDLGVTKGSFYWHFVDRAELLDVLLSTWEDGTRELVAEVRGLATPRARVLGLFEGLARRGVGPADGWVFAWAAGDAAVGRRVTGVESRRIEFIREQLSAAGLEGAEAGRRSHVVYLTMMGWIERAQRAGRSADPGPFARHVYALVLAPSPVATVDWIG